MSRLSHPWHAFWNAVGFLTRFPVPRQTRMEAWSSSPTWYPLVGLLLGGVLALVAMGLQQVAPPLVTAMLLVTLWVYLTGGLHLDGLMDTGDGFGSQRPRERVLEIMKDSRVGAMGVLTAGLVLGNKLIALSSLTSEHLLWALLLAPLLARSGMVLAMNHLPYARAQGLGEQLRGVGTGPALGAIVLAGGLGLFILQLAWVPALLGAGLTAVVLIRTSLRKLGGLTGDVYGALCELIETAVLLGLVIGQGMLV